MDGRSDERLVVLVPLIASDEQDGRRGGRDQLSE
jgi:hypothetical protein